MAAHPLGESRTVDAGGRRLALREAGPSTGGSATVVFEAGLGMSGVIWGLVAPEIARRTRTVVYDRAGLGASDVHDAPRTLSRLADDLAAVLATLPGPFVLVGHSWGGPILRTLAARRPPGLTGLVLVDPSDERDDTFFLPATARRMAVAGPLTRTLAAVGLYTSAARIGRALPRELFAQFRAENFDRRTARTFSAEVREFLPGLAALRADPPDLGDLPVTIVSAGTGPNRAAHAETAAALRNGRLVVAENAGHNLMFERPALVVDEILRLVG